MGRPNKEMKPPPYLITKDLRLKIVNEMISMVCDAIVEEIKNENSIVYEVMYNYIDSPDYILDEETKQYVKKNYLREMDHLLAYTRDFKGRCIKKQFTGGKHKKNSAPEET